MKYHFILLIFCIGVMIGGCSRNNAQPEPTSTPDSEEASAANTTDEETATSTPEEAETPAEDEDSESTEAETSSDASAESDSVLNSPLAAPLNSPLPVPPEINVVTSDTAGAISGQLIALDEQGNYKPVAGYIVGLADLVQREDGEGALAAAYDVGRSPVTKTNEFGQFVFNTVEPGQYDLILDAVVNQALLSYPDGSEEGKGSILLELEADQHIDLGALQYDSLPIQGFAN